MISIEFVLLLIGLNYLRRLILVTRHWHSISDSPAWDVVGRTVVWLMVVGAVSIFVGYGSYVLGRMQFLDYL